MPNNDPTQKAVGPGVLYRAPIGTAQPSMTAAAGLFTDAWPAAWVPWGYTEQGHTFSAQVQTGAITPAEELDPIAVVTTGRTSTVTFALMQVNPIQVKFGLNGGTISVLSGSGATIVNKYSPVAAGAEVRTILGWEADDHTERMIWWQCLNTGNVQIARQKAPNNATIPVEFTLEKPTGDMWNYYATSARTAA